MVQNFTQSTGVEISETTVRGGFMGKTQQSTGTSSSTDHATKKPEVQTAVANTKKSHDMG
jgi:hypothetical protein